MRGIAFHPVDRTPAGPRKVHRGLFAVWLVLGTLVGIGMIVFPASVLVVALIGALLLRRPGARSSVSGAISGVGVTLLIVAWIQRQGPGTTCWHTATSFGCEQHLNPIPWLIAGVVLLVAGAAAAWRRGS